MTARRSTRKRKKKLDEDYEYESSSEDSQDETYIPSSSSRTTKSKTPNKKTKVEKKPHKKQKVEKRLARFRSKPNQQIRDRIERALTQRLFLIDHSGDDQNHKFVVLGSTGNVYEVNICKLPTCNCPDAEKGNICKHLLFVYLKVLKVPKDSELIYQKALLSSEIAQILSTKKYNEKKVMADRKVIEVYKRASQGSQEESQNRREYINVPCPICFDEMNKLDTTEYCRSCGNNFHLQCWQMWEKQKKKLGNAVTCVLCRALNLGKFDATKDLQGSEGYVNLGKLQPGMSTEREPYVPSWNPYSYWWRY